MKIINLFLTEKSAIFKEINMTIKNISSSHIEVIEGLSLANTAKEEANRLIVNSLIIQGSTVLYLL